MNTRTLIEISGLCLFAGVLDPAQGAEKSRYWELGWGLYGGEGLDVARFDWHMICFGNVPSDQRTVDALNEVLRINPRHKLLIRVWPIMGKGDCEENRFQATLFHYLYKPGVREKVLAETRRQVDLVCRGVARPENVYGCVFLEELPGHFTGLRNMTRWQPGDELPWDMKRFQKEIAAELGEPFDWTKEKHRLWWGKKYCSVIEEINRTMKEASGGKRVFYYQATAWHTLDHLDTMPPEQRSRANVLPIHYADILKPGVCDGIFGYPNNALIWANQTQSVVSRQKCLLFSQMSLPPGMRICRFDEMVELARWNNPGNVGSFLYSTHGRKTRAWNELEYQDASSFWTVDDHVRRFGWQHKIGQEIVDRALSPAMQFVYDLSTLGKGPFFHLTVHVTNRRDPSWYEGSVEQATLRNVAVTLRLPDGFRLLPSNSGPPTLKLGDLPPQATRLADWWVLAEQAPATIPAGQSFRVVLSSTNAPRTEAASQHPAAAIPCFQRRLIARSGERWTEPLDKLPSMQAAVELTALADIQCPEVGSSTRSATYRDVLRARERLIIGSGLSARLFAHALFDDTQRQFPAGPEGAAAFDHGYLVHQTAAVPVRPGQKYRISVTGWAKAGGNSMVLVRFSWREPRKRAPATHDVSCLVNQFGPREKTVSHEVEVPRVPGKEVTMRLLFYRFQSRGVVYYKSFDCARLGFPEHGLDVRDRIQGALPDLEAPLTDWLYRDLSDPDRYGKPKLELRFLSPEEIETLEKTAPPGPNR
jgi:hypothetical protein